jgi:tRNA(Ile)-lysidine synthase
MDILKAIRKYKMMDACETVLVAISGGPDSVCLLHNLKEISSELNIKLCAAHVNHSIRDEESNKDEAFVKDLCSDWQIPIFTTKIDIPAKSKELKLGIEETARILRYKFLNETALNIGADRIAIGHNADDRAETLLFNIIRGCGIDGLSSIKPTNGNIIRPLIDTTRAEIEEYIELHNLPYKIDGSNADITYTRNKIRHVLFPILKDSFNPAIIDSLVKLADTASKAQSFITKSSEQARVSALMKGNLDQDLLCSFSDIILAEIIRAEIEKQRGNLNDIDFDCIQRIICSIKNESFAVHTLAGGDFAAVIKKRSFSVKPITEDSFIEPFEYQLEIPGSLVVPEAGVEIKIELINSIPDIIDKDKNCAYFDLDKIKPPLKIRNFIIGDKMSLFGMSGHKKLHDIFIDAKIPHEKRGFIPILCDSDSILWVAGIKRSNEAIFDENSRELIKCHYQLVLF